MAHLPADMAAGAGVAALILQEVQVRLFFLSSLPLKPTLSLALVLLVREDGADIGRRRGRNTKGSIYAMPNWIRPSTGGRRGRLPVGR